MSIKNSTTPSGIEPQRDIKLYENSKPVRDVPTKYGNKVLFNLYEREGNLTWVLFKTNEHKNQIGLCIKSL